MTWMLWLIVILGASVAFAGWCLCRRGGQCDRHLEATRRQIKEAALRQQSANMERDKEIERIMEESAKRA